jgi:hypothetical protein
MKIRQEDGAPSLSTMIRMETERIHKIDGMWPFWSMNRRIEMPDKMITNGSQDGCVFLQNQEMIPRWKECVGLKD